MFGITRAPELDRAGLDWFNVTRPLSLADLRGRLVVLDFWTFCCINCIHALPVLHRLEETYPDEVAVIGVHSPKFDAERDPAKVAEAIRRYGVLHPVAHDPHGVLWDEYGVRAWPTLVFVSPDGHVIGQISGEPQPEALIEGVGDMLREFRELGELRPAALPLDAMAEPEGRLSHPGKIRAAGGGAWAVADAGHHQIVLLDDAGARLRRYGSGIAGFEDGDAETACFDRPQGLACTAQAIYVADTGNHALRRIDRASGAVTTIAGIGVRGGVLKGRAAGRGCALASPWDVAAADGRLYFANAGSHQLGVVDLRTGAVAPLAGAGGEDIVDGAAPEALLAQPSGLALSPDGATLYFADSETSAIRALSLPEGRVSTLVGRGLFAFGHRDGSWEEALLQHPLDVAASDGRLVVADSYNDRLRVLDLAARTVAGLDPGACADDPCRPFAEPAGVAVAGRDRLLLSDTNNHRIVEIRLDEGRYRTWFE